MKHPCLMMLLATLAFLGFLDATYLTVEHLRGTIPPCTVVQGCDTVLTSQYAAFYGFPIAGLGVLYYGILLALLVAYVDAGNERIFRFICFFTTVGLAASAYFMVLQAFVLNSYCLYCLISAGISTLIFTFGMVGLAVSRSDARASVVEPAQ